MVSRMSWALVRFISAAVLSSLERSAVGRARGIGRDLELM